jgi:3-deoxy-D-manno-octulosonate 8-phosphate phosphatase (KDO 8-P phosphatase)
MPAKQKKSLDAAKKLSVEERCARIRLFLCDVDGILTDTSVFIGKGVELKRFNIRDGMGIKLLQESGFKVGWISRRPSTATTARAEELKIDFLVQTKGSKVEAAEDILTKTGLGWDEVSFMGDDIVDLGMLNRAGLAVTVPGAPVEVRKISHYCTVAEGGHGAVREVIEMVLKAQGLWASIITQHNE